MERLKNICACCSVDVFAMMSGYFGINRKKVTVYRIVELISIVMFYSVIITLGFLGFAPAKLAGMKDILKGIFPSFAGRYWYITCFIPVLLFQPYLNKMLLSLTEKQHLAMILTGVLIFSCIPSFLLIDFFKFNNGYSFVWLLFLYSVGAYIERNKEDGHCKLLKKYGMVLFFIISLILLFGNILIVYFLGFNLNYMIAYTSPFVLAMGFSAMLSLSDAKINVGGKIITILSAAAFDVYIIHSHMLIFDLVLTDAFAWIRECMWYCVPVVCLGCAVGVFLMCAIVAFFRIQLFRVLHINHLIAKLSAQIDNLLYADSMLQR